MPERTRPEHTQPKATLPEAFRPTVIERTRSAPTCRVPGSRWNRRKRPNRADRQLEFALEPRLAPALEGSRRSRALVQPSQRLLICPEAFAPSASRAAPPGDRAGGLIECAMVMLTTIVFGVGWAALELEHPAAGGPWDPGYAPGLRSPLSEGANPGTQDGGAIHLDALEAHAWRGKVPDERRGPPNSEGMPWSSRR